LQCYFLALIKSAIDQLRFWQLFSPPCIYSDRKKRAGHLVVASAWKFKKRNFWHGGMNMRTLNRFFWFFLLALLLGISGSARGSDVGTTTAASKDAVLTQQLQQDFSRRMEFRNVTVAVDDRVALLQGSVETYREKMDAERLARKRHGIEGVRDFIAVQPVVPVSDQELRETIANRLRYDRIGYGITFNNFEVGVRDGVVTIAGDARSYPDKASALSIVEDTPGVGDVRDEINVLPLSEFDDELRVRTAMAIYSDPALQKYSLDPQAPIRIVVENGNVRLYGVVNSAMDKQIAEMRAREVGGVFSVENHLLVANQ
jgi:osmotically-inducible protein OsmY